MQEQHQSGHEVQVQQPQQQPQQQVAAIPAGAQVVIAPNAFQSMQSSRREALEFFAKYPEQMTVDALCDAGLPVYVQNHLDRPGRVAVDFEISGKRTSITVPNGWLPVNLNDRMNPSDIRSSGSLRDTLRNGAIILLHPTEAMELLASPRGQRELEKQRSQYAKAKGEKAVKVQRENADGSSNNVTGRMQMLVIELEKTKKDTPEHQDILDKIFNNLRAFTAADVEYFKVKTTGDAAAQAQAEEMYAELEKREEAVNRSFQA